MSFLRLCQLCQSSELLGEPGLVVVVLYDGFGWKADLLTVTLNVVRRRCSGTHVLWWSKSGPVITVACGAHHQLFVAQQVLCILDRGLWGDVNACEDDR